MYIRLSYQQRQALKAIAKASHPDEGCGLLLGTETDVSKIIQVTNVSKQPHYHYEMHAQQLFDALSVAESQNLSVVGFFHTHPTSNAIPSPEDVKHARTNNPNTIHIIISLANEQIMAKAWYITAIDVQSVDILLPSQTQNESRVALTNLQVYAILIFIVVAFAFFLAVSFSLLPPAPIIPTPRG